MLVPPSGLLPRRSSYPLFLVLLPGSTIQWLFLPALHGNVYKAEVYIPNLLSHHIVQGAPTHTTVLGNTLSELVLRMFARPLRQTCSLRPREGVCQHLHLDSPCLWYLLFLPRWLRGTASTFHRPLSILGADVTLKTSATFFLCSSWSLP